MLGMIIKILIAAIIAYISYIFWWWAPILTFPGAFMVIPKFATNSPYELKNSTIEFRRIFFYLFSSIFIGFEIYIFHVNIEGWYGWLIGMFLSWFGVGSIAADLEEYLFFRQR